LPAETDVVVVGAGYTGLSAARQVARRGRQVVVLERDHVGHGPSGRNGGMAHAGVSRDAASLLELPGGRAMWNESVAAFEELERVAPGLDCQWQRCGHLELAGHRRHVPRLQLSAVAQQALGERSRFVGRDELAAEIGSSAFDGALLVERSAAVQPTLLARGLAHLAAEEGARVHPGVEVISLGRSADGSYTVCTSGGEVHAGQVVLATGSATARLAPWVSRRVLAVGSYIIATEPVDAELARSVSPRGRVFFDTRNFLNYWRLSPDGRRVVFGGRTSFGPTTVERARDQLYAAMVAVHPQLAGVRVERAWGGMVDLSVDRAPHLGRDPRSGAHFAIGYSGTGVVMATHLGAVVGRLAAGDEEASSFATGRFTSVPWMARVPGLLPVAGLWYRARDMAGV
jgi:glycine/D-amino acid oxidase-like deaminating enzyme